MPQLDLVWARINYAGLNMDSFIIGMLNKEEIDENCRIVNAENME